MVEDNAKYLNRQNISVAIRYETANLDKTLAPPPNPPRTGSSARPSHIAENLNSMSQQPTGTQQGTAAIAKEAPLHCSLGTVAVRQSGGSSNHLQGIVHKQLSPTHATTPTASEIAGTSSSDLSQMASLTANVVTGRHQSENSHRHQRNNAEKHRRDELNSLVEDIAKRNPITANESRKLDRNTNLRLAAAFMQNRIVWNNIVEDAQLPASRTISMLTPENLYSLLADADGFFLITDRDGYILEVSNAVQSLLGYQQIDMLNSSILEFVHDAEQDDVKRMIRTAMNLAISDRAAGDTTKRERFSFNCQMLEKTQQKGQQRQFQPVHVRGIIVCLSELSQQETDPSPDPNQFIVVATVRLLSTKSPLTRISFMDSDQYISLHKMDGTIAYVDHRISNITGHMPQEVINMSAHIYMKKDDVRIALFAQEKLLLSGEGSVVYRLRTRTNNFIHLRSTGFVRKESPDTVMFVCINTLINSGNGERERKEFQSRFKMEAIGFEDMPEENDSNERDDIVEETAETAVDDHHLRTSDHLSSPAYHSSQEISEVSPQNSSSESLYQSVCGYRAYDSVVPVRSTHMPISYPQSVDTSDDSIDHHKPLYPPLLGRRMVDDNLNCRVDRRRGHDAIDAGMVAPKRMCRDRSSPEAPGSNYAYHSISVPCERVLSSPDISVMAGQITPNSSPLSPGSEHSMSNPVFYDDRRRCGGQSYQNAYPISYPQGNTLQPNYYQNSTSAVSPSDYIQLNSPLSTSSSSTISDDQPPHCQQQQ